jgi:gas vesicle protein
MIISFLIGVFVGGILGIVIMALLAAGKDERK